MITITMAVGGILLLIYGAFFSSSKSSHDRSTSPAPVSLGFVENSSTSTSQNHRNPFQVMSNTVHVVTTGAACRELVRQIRDHCRNFPVLGLDCEWITTYGERQKVALLQLASDGGLCLLIRLFKMDYIPSELKELLADAKVIKVGVEVFDDGRKLLDDYNINVNGTLDLRFLARKLGIRGRYGLAGLAETILAVKLNKDWHLSASDWESDTLSALQLEYAAKDAIVALDIFRAFKRDVQWSALDQYLDTPFQRKRY